MLFIPNNNTNPYYNHAAEEWLIDNTDDDCFMLWQNEPAVLLGRHQNAYAEVNLGYAAERGIKIVRRISGGGTVFTDSGNIMFTYISRNKDDFADFTKFAAPVLTVLRGMGVPAEFSGRNDLLIDGKKFCGNAQAVYHGGLLHHGTLMYSAGIIELGKVLNPRPIKLVSKGVASVTSRVTNISSHMENPPDIKTFKDMLFNGVIKSVPDAKLFVITEEQWLDIAKSAEQKHAAKEWIFGSAPDYEIHREAKLPAGLVEGYFKTSRGKIVGARIYGDFFGDGDLSEVEDALIGTLYEKKEIEKRLLSLEIEKYFRGITAEQLVEALT